MEKVKVHIHSYVNDQGEHQWHPYPYALNGSGFTPVLETELEFKVPAGFDWRKAGLASFEAMEKDARAEFQAKMTTIEAAKQKLLAITMGE